MRKTMVKYNLVAERIKSYESVGCLTATYMTKDALNAMFRLSEQAEEVFALLCLDTKKQIIAGFEVSRGTLDTTVVGAREIFKRAITDNAHSIIIGHNHPSGQVKPSRNDVQITEVLIKAGKLLDIEVLDHVIIGENDSYYSFLEQGEI